MGDKKTMWDLCVEREACHEREACENGGMGKERFHQLVARGNPTPCYFELLDTFDTRPGGVGGKGAWILSPPTMRRTFAGVK